MEINQFDLSSKIKEANENLKESLNEKTINRLSEKINQFPEGNILRDSWEKMKNKEEISRIVNWVLPDGKLNPSFKDDFKEFKTKAENWLNNFQQKIENDPDLNTTENKGLISKMNSFFSMVSAWFSGEYEADFFSIFVVLSCIALIIVDPLPGIIDEILLVNIILSTMGNMLDNFESWKTNQAFSNL